MKNSFLIAVLLLSGCSQTAIYNGQEVKVLDDVCSSNPPYSCYKKIELPDGQQVEVPPEKLES